MRAIETRQKQIADGLAAGEQGRQSLASAEKRDRRHAGRGEARSSRRSSRRARSARPRRSRQAKVEAKAEADRILAAAKAEIEQEVARAKEALRDQVADLAVAGAAKILKREVDAKAHADLLGGDPAAALTDTAMAELTTIARPYAEAAFRLARDAQRAAGVVADAALRRRGRRRSAGRARRSTIRSSTAGDKEALLLSICGDAARRRRPQLRARAGRGRPRRACCRRSRTLFEALKDDADGVAKARDRHARSR